MKELNTQKPGMQIHIQSLFHLKHPYYLRFLLLPTGVKKNKNEVKAYIKYCR